MAENWTRAENEAVVADYLTMLELELVGQSFNKAEHNRQLRKVLSQRSKGSVELKHQNISAVLIELGYPYITGYKPRRNYQDMLFDVVLAHVNVASGLLSATRAIVERTMLPEPSVGDLLAMLVPPPKREESSRERTFLRAGRSVGSTVNWLECEARNRVLGEAGELLVLKFEHERLWQAKRKDLADRIEHVAKTKGDGLGYDVLSFEPTGKERLIEVKTTQFGSETPFFVSRNEVTVSRDHVDQYHLYRLFDFKRDAKLFQLAGAIDQTCLLEPWQFSASVA